MLTRYSRPEMANIWTEENKYRAWLEVETMDASTARAIAVPSLRPRSFMSRISAR